MLSRITDDDSVGKSHCRVLAAAYRAIHERRHDMSAALPRIEACFLVRFDAKIGYTIAWRRTNPGLELDGVEYKSLPSGLHNVNEDLIYFIHGSHAGVSAFKSAATAQHERNTLSIGVGVLVPLTHGRLGKSWLHAGSLQKLAEYVCQHHG
ncbi:hypothetical protein MRB53_040955 [Persea americana]|nr:hypothetical protein MRB53_040955 [Persea americana]